jgi:hypothetical protein
MQCKADFAHHTGEVHRINRRSAPMMMARAHLIDISVTRW